MSDNDFYDPAHYSNPNYEEPPEYESEPEYEQDPDECDFEEEEICCENCSNELTGNEGDYNGLCEECYTRTHHPQIWAEQQTQREWEEHLEEEDEEEEEEINEEDRIVWEGLLDDMERRTDIQNRIDRSTERRRLLMG
jgi:hypothetical protein